MSDLARYVDYRPDEMIAGVAAQLDPEEFGVYWMICTLIYSKRGPIDDDMEWLAGLFRKTNPRTVRAALDRLVARGKVHRIQVEGTSKLMVERCRTELEKTAKRISSSSENGAKGGRKPKETSDLAKPAGSPEEKLTTNHQPPTTNEENGKEGEKAPALDEVQIAFDAFNEVAAQLELPQAQVLNKTRRRHLAARLVSVGGITGWPAVMDRIRASAFCQGKTDRGDWRIDLDALCQLKTFTKLMEGSYDDRKGSRSAPAQRGDGFAAATAAAADVIAGRRTRRGQPATAAGTGPGADVSPPLGGAAPRPLFDEATDPWGAGSTGTGAHPGGAG